MNETQETILDILILEVAKIIKTAKTRKAPDPDIRDIYVEIAGTFPKDWLKFTFISIPKKSKANKCSQFRLISLMSQVLKVLLNTK
ncbi:hypothetical protein ILUMI_16028 [Ignelater luminosus]|uniref:Uncharacterized protein n=1 Tax=Ignelater luminosus TaxID=2038154 RepID=A0A8K0G3A2_IGNLU|nr:hypothetical protein ILUMI_16028 [Ignelater luminosus]